MAFHIQMSAPVPFQMPYDFYNQQAYDNEGRPLGSPLEVAVARWNDGEFPTEPGEHQDVPVYVQTPVLFDNGYGMQVPVGLFVNLYVTRNIYLGHLAIEKIRGLRDEQTGHVVTNAFTTGRLDPEEVATNWQKIEDGQELPYQPFLTVAGLECWEIR